MGKNGTVDTKTMKKEQLDAIQICCVIIIIIAVILFLATIIYNEGYKTAATTIIMNLTQKYCLTPKLYEWQTC